jgi:arylsulfatase A-like enzyme
MKRRDFIQSVGVGTAAVAAGAGQVQRPPNIVIMLADDQGYTDVGCFGAEGFETPNLDRLAAEGMQFTNFHVPQAVCSASRTALLTGCYPNRIGITGALSPNTTHGISADEMTIADMLKKQGYATGIFGKWHLGHHKPFLPLQHGFDEYLGLPYSNDMWPVWYDGTPCEGGTSDDPELAKKRKSKAKYPPLPLIDGNETVRIIGTLQDQDELTTLYTERAIGFIRKHRADPFFLYVPQSMPHVPLGVSDKFRGKSKQGMYGDVIMEIDWSMGQIMKTLDECGVADNTLVIYLSDNGPWMNFGNHAGSCRGLREGKGSEFEGGIRTPCIMRWPQKIAAGSKCGKLGATMDILPTLARYAGGTLPEHKIDGVDIGLLLEGGKGASPRQELYCYFKGGQLQAVYDGRWKLILPHKYRTYADFPPGKDGFPGELNQNKQAEKALYDLETDRAETTDLQHTHPEIVARLEKMVEKARVDLGDDLTKRKGANVREPGRIGG